jgi:hypothetical protein
MKSTKPFPSFSLLLPDEVTEDHRDTNVVSYWIAGDSCLLQLSSFMRNSGKQIPATERLSERIRNGGQWKSLEVPHAANGCEAAAAQTTDDNGTTWVHAYLVWPWLSIHVTVSRNGDPLACEWPWAALSTIRPVLM